MQRYQDAVIQQINGIPVVGASVLVQTFPALATASIFSDNGVTAAGNPLTTDANGRFAFYAADGRYSLTISKTGFSTQTISDILLEDPVDPSVAAIAVVASIAAMKALSAAQLTGQVRTMGYYASGDGGGGLFRWNAADSSADNGGTVIAPNAGGTGRWNRIVDQSAGINVKWFGAKGDGVTDDTAAIQATVNSLTSGGICYFPIGTYKLTSTVTIGANGILLLGSRANGSVISFVPSVAGAAFSFTAGASILSYCGIEGFQFTSTDTTTAKDMVRVSDVSYFEARKLVAIDNAWKGGTSVGLRLRGREEIRIRDCQIYTDKPLVVEANPNNATTMLDHSSVETSSLVVTSALTNPCVDFTGSGNVTNIAFKRVAFVRGAGAIKCNLTSATASQVFEIENCRSEQTAGTTQNSLDFSESGGSNIQGLSVKNFTFDPNLNGIKLRNCLYVNLQDILLTSSTKTNLDVDSTVDYLNLHNFFSQSGGTISGLANVKDLTRIGYVTGSNASLNSVQRLIADAITTAPTIPAGFTGLGASGTVTVDAGSSDLAGSITLSPAGAGIAGVGNLTLTFNAGYTNAPIVVANGAVGSASWADAPVMQVQPSGASCLIRWMNGPTPTNLTSGQTYKITYVVLGK